MQVIVYTIPMKKKPIVAQQDLDTFLDAVKGAKPITHDKIPLGKLAVRTPATLRQSKHVGHRSVELNEAGDFPPVSGETPISYNQSGVSHKILRNLRKGQYNVEAILDLHGMTTAEAKKTVSKFLLQCINDGARVVLIIHGKGRGSQPILKNKLNQWLRGILEVLAFCTASTAHGSRGAMYVLLKRTHLEEK